MIVAVLGSDGLGPVLGLAGASPTELLQAVRERPDSHVALLTPAHRETDAREQAHVAVAAVPTLRVYVAALAHHALTLTLLGGLLTELEGQPEGWSDAGEAVQLLRRTAAASRSVLWYPRARTVGRTAPTFGQRLGSVFVAPGYFGEIDVPGLVPGRQGMSARPDERWYSSGSLPATLRDQLGDTPVHETAISLGEPRPYAGRGTVELTAVVRPHARVVGEAPCPSCGTSAGAAGCVFCGSGPRPPLTVVSTTAARTGGRRHRTPEASGRGWRQERRAS